MSNFTEKSVQLFILVMLSAFSALREIMNLRWEKYTREWVLDLNLLNWKTSIVNLDAFHTYPALVLAVMPLLITLIYTRTNSFLEVKIFLMTTIVVLWIFYQFRNLFLHYIFTITGTGTVQKFGIIVALTLSLSYVLTKS